MNKILNLVQHRVNLLLCRFDDLIGHCLLHEVDLTLADDLHQLILERDHKLRRPAPTLGLAHSSLKTFDPLHATTLHRASLRRAVLDRWVNKERIILAAEPNVLCKVRVIEAYRSIRLHLEQIVLILPDKWDILELLDVVPLLWHDWAGHAAWSLLALSRQQEVVDELLPPLDDALNNME